MLRVDGSTTAAQHTTIDADRALQWLPVPAVRAQRDRSTELMRGSQGARTGAARLLRAWTGKKHGSPVGWGEGNRAIYTAGGV